MFWSTVQYRYWLIFFLGRTWVQNRACHFFYYSYHTLAKPQPGLVAGTVAAIGSTLTSIGREKLNEGIRAVVQGAEDYAFGTAEETQEQIVAESRAHRPPGVYFDSSGRQEGLIPTRTATLEEQEQRIEDLYSELKKENKAKKGKKYKLPRDKQRLGVPTEVIRDTAEEEELAPRRKTTRRKSRKPSIKVALRKKCRAEAKRLREKLRTCERDLRSLK